LIQGSVAKFGEPWIDPRSRELILMKEIGWKEKVVEEVLRKVVQELLRRMGIIEERRNPYWILDTIKYEKSTRYLLRSCQHLPKILFSRKAQWTVGKRRILARKGLAILCRLIAFRWRKRE
jgi:hypothetical protein